MTQEEAVSAFLKKKQNEGLSNSSIRSALKTEYQFSDEEVKTILIEISNLELDEIKNKKKNPLSFLEGKAASYFFLLFGLTAIVVSIFSMQNEPQNELAKFLPWVMILGALFIIYKHAYRIYKG